MALTQDHIAALAAALKDKPNGTETFEDMLLTHQYMAMDHLDKDRCLLRRDMKLSQNERFALGDEDLQRVADETCEDSEMQVHIDRSKKVVHNHGGEQPQPHPHPHPHPRLRPLWWWLWLFPLVVLLVVLIFWLVYIWPDPSPPQPIQWELDIGAVDPIEQALSDRQE